MDTLTKLVDAEQEYLSIVRSVQDEAPSLLQRIRNERGWTQAELAAYLDYDQAYISRIERGRMRAGIPILLALARRFAPQ
jgi:DNA-binding XRE family transcriptional regulator